MSEWKNYRKVAIQPMRPYVHGEDLTGVSVSDADDPENETGGMIACNPHNPSDRWYVGPKFFRDNYEEAQ